jgi:hypothetical protein
MKIKQTLFIIIILLISLSCKKIDTPNEEAEAIFGEWQYNHHSGGLSGAGGSNLFNESSWIEFTEKGFYKVYEGTKKIKRARFTILENETGYHKYTVLITKGMGRYNYNIDGEKLVLSADYADGFSYVFTRK